MRRHRWLWTGLLAAVAVGMAACGPKKAAENPEPRPVRTVTAKPQEAGETVVLTGHIQAEDEASMAFRIGGRMTDRFVNVGDRVKAGQELASSGVSLTRLNTRPPPRGAKLCVTCR